MRRSWARGSTGSMGSSARLCSAVPERRSRFSRAGIRRLSGSASGEDLLDVPSVDVLIRLEVVERPVLDQVRGELAQRQIAQPRIDAAVEQALDVGDGVIEQAGLVAAGGDHVRVAVVGKD